MSIDKQFVVLKRFFGNSLSELCKTLRHLQSFLVAFSKFNKAASFNRKKGRQLTTVTYSSVLSTLSKSNTN